MRRNTYVFCFGKAPSDCELDEDEQNSERKSKKSKRGSSGATDILSSDTGGNDEGEGLVEPEGYRSEDGNY